MISRQGYAETVVKIILVLLGGSWATFSPLGLLFSLLGSFWALLGCTWALLGRSWAFLGDFLSIWAGFGRVLGGFWEVFGRFSVYTRSHVANTPHVIKPQFLLCVPPSSTKTAFWAPNTKFTKN